jgi:hypothetical protein
MVCKACIKRVTISLDVSIETLEWSEELLTFKQVAIKPPPITAFAGPTSGAYSFEETIDSTGAVVWSPCNSPIPLNINNRVRLTGDSNSAGNGVLYDSGILDLTLQWKSC